MGKNQSVKDSKKLRNLPIKEINLIVNVLWKIAVLYWMKRKYSVCENLGCRL